MSRVPRHSAELTPDGRWRRLIASIASAALLLGGATVAAQALPVAPDVDEDQTSGEVVGDQTVPQAGDATDAGATDEPGTDAGDATEAPSETTAPEPVPTQGDGEAAVPGENEVEEELTSGTDPPAGEDGAIEVESLDEPVTVTPMLISPSTTEIRVNARTIATARGTTSSMTTRNCNYNFTTNAWDCSNSTSTRVQRGSNSVWNNTSYTDGASYQLYSFVTNNPATGVLVDEDWARCTIGEGDSLPGSGFCTITVPNTAVGDPATDPQSENFQKQFWVRQVDSPAGTYSNPIITLGNSSLSNPQNWEIPGLTRRMVGEGVTWPGGGGQPAQTTPGIFEVPRTAQFETDPGMVSLGAMPYSIENPEFEPTCEGGVTIALVMDVSGSTSSYRSIYRDAITGTGGILDVLSGTGSSIATFTFSTDSPAAGTSNFPALTPIPAGPGADRNALNTRINNQINNGSGFTNWDAGFRAVSNATQFDDYDFVMFITDGAPNRLINNAGTGQAAPNGSDISLAAIEAAIFSSNSVKVAGKSVLTVAVGNGVASAEYNLRAVSGTGKGSDYFMGEWEELADMIGDLARSATCQIPVEVTKVLQNADGTNERPGVGWDITLDPSDPDGTIEAITPTDLTQATDTDGEASWLVQLNDPDGDVGLNISEDQTSGDTGFSFYEGSCTVSEAGEDDIVLPMTDGAVDVTGLHPGHSVDCRIVNRDIATATVVINKVTDTVTGDAFPFDSDLPATGAFTGGGALIGAGPEFTLPGGGSYTVTVPVESSAGMTVAEAVDDAALWPDGWRPNGAPICTYTGVPAGTALPASTDVGSMEITTALLPNSTLTCTFSNTDAEPSWTTWKLSNPGGSNTQVPTPPITEVLPDGTIVYYLYAQNDGNRPVENAVMTDNLDVSAANGVLQHATPVGFADGTVTPVGSAGSVATQVTLMDRSGGGDANGTTVPDDQSSIPLADRGSVEFDEAAGTLTWSIPELPVGGFLRLSFPVKVNSDAFGVQLHNQLLSTGDVEPLECEQGDNATARCNTWHETGTPEWTLTKSSDPASGSTVAPGDTITYTVTATNSTNVPVTGVEIEDDLSEVLNNAELVSGPTASAGTATLPDGSTTLTWAIPVLGANATETVTYTVRVNADATGVTIGNVVTGEGIVPPEPCEPNDPECRETEHFTPAYTLVKDSDPESGSTVLPGGTIDYTLTVTNTSDVDFEENLVIHDDLSEVLNNAELTGGPTVSPDDASFAVLTGNTLTWTITELPAGETVTVTYQVTVNDDATGVTLKNVATGDEEFPPEPCEPNDPECRETEHVTPEWTIEKSSDPASGSTVLPGSDITYTVRATNTSDADAEDIVITDDLSEVLNNAEITAGPTATVGTASVTGDTLTWTLGTLAANSTATVTYTVTVNDDATGVTLKNVVTGDGETPPEPCADDDPECNETEHFTPAYTLVKDSDPASGSTVLPGSDVEYTLTVTNTTDYAITDGLTITDDLSNVLNNAELVTPLADGLSLTGTTLTWTIPTLAANATVEVSYTVTVNDDATGVTIGNVVTGDEEFPPEPCADDDPECRETEHHTPEWTLAKTADPASGTTVLPGSEVTYTLTATNDSDAPAEDVVVTDDLSNVLNNAVLTAGPTASAGTAQLAGTTLTWTVGTLAAGATETVTYTVTINEDALGVTIGNVVTGEGSVPPEECTPEEPCETTHETPGVWSLSKTSDPATGSTVEPGGVITYTVTATNVSDKAISDAVVTDDLSNVLNHASLTGGPTASIGTASVAGTTLTWNIGDLPANSTHTVTYEVTVDEDALGVTIGNVVTGEGSEPPEECTPEEPCETTHETDPAWTLVKDSDPASGSTVLPGSEITYTVTATNISRKPATDIVITDDLSGVLNHAVLTDGPTTAVGTASVTGDTLTWNLGTLAANSTATVTYTVTVNEDATGVTIGNVVTGEGEVPPEPCEPEDPECNETEHFTPAYTLVKSSDPVSGSTVLPGSDIAYTLTVTNTSDGDFEDDLVINDDLSQVLNNAVLKSGPSATVGTAAIADATLTWTIPSLGAGETVTVTYTVTVNDDATGVTLKNVATGDEEFPPEPCEPEDPECNETEHFTPEWTLVKDSDPASGSTVQPGSDVVYTLTATNTSDAVVKDAKAIDDLSNVLNNAELVEPLAPGLDLEGDTLTWTIPTLQPGESATVSYTVTVNEDAYGVTIGNVVTGEGEVPPEPCEPEDPECRETEHPTPAWTIKKESDPVSGSTVLPGSDIVYTLTVENVSDGVVEGEIAIDDLSEVLNNAVLVESSLEGKPLAFDADAETLTWAIPTLQPGETAAVTYTVTVNSDALGVWLRNAVTSPGSVECVPEDEGDGGFFGWLGGLFRADADEDELCPTTTEHVTPEWTLAKTSDPASGTTVLPGSDIVYTLTVTNTFEADAENVVVTDDLSNVLNNAALKAGPTASLGAAELEGTTLTWTVGTLPAGATETVTYTVTIDEDALGIEIGNVATGTGSVPPTECTPQEPCETDHKTPEVWSISKTSDPATGSTVEPGDTITYTVTATNSSERAIAGAVVTDDLSNVLNNATLTEGPTASIGTAALADTTLTWNIGDLPAKSTHTLTYTVTVDADAYGVTIGNVVSGDGSVPPEECTPEEPCETEHGTDPIWTLVKASDPAKGSTVLPGTDVAYTVTVTNPSKSAVTDIVVVDDLSQVLNNAELVDGPTASTGTAQVEGTELTWTIPSLAAGATETVTYTVTIDEGATGVTLKNVVTGEGEVPPEPCEPEDPECNETEHFTPEWTLVKDSDPASGSTVLPGSDVTYTLTATNTSDAVVKDAKAIDDMSNVLGHAVLAQPLAEGLALEGTTLTWTIPTLEPGESASVDYTVTVNEDATGVTIGNVVTGEGEVPPEPCEPEDPECNETEHFTPEWTLVKDSDPASGSTVLPGSDVTYTLTATNTSDAVVKDVKAIDDMSKVLGNAVLVQPLAEGLALGGTTLTWTIPTLEPGDSATVSYTVTVNEDALGVTIGNVVTGEGTTPPEPCEPEDPECRETEHFTPAWTLEKSSDPKSGSKVEAGQKVTYTLTARNTSDADVVGAKAIDDMSKVLDRTTLQTPLADGLALDGTTLTWTIPTLKPGEQASISYSVVIKSFKDTIQLKNVVAPAGPGGECIPGKCTTTHPGGGMPSTGATIGTAAGIALVLLLGGGTAVVLSKRRRRGREI